MTTYAISNKKSGAVQGATNVKSTVGDSALTKNTPKATSPRMAVDIRGIFKKVSFLEKKKEGKGFCGKSSI